MFIEWFINNQKKIKSCLFEYGYKLLRVKWGMIMASHVDFLDTWH